MMGVIAPLLSPSAVRSNIAADDDEEERIKAGATTNKRSFCLALVEALVACFKHMVSCVGILVLFGVLFVGTLIAYSKTSLDIGENMISENLAWPVTQRRTLSFRQPSMPREHPAATKNSSTNLSIIVA